MRYDMAMHHAMMALTSASAPPHCDPAEPAAEPTGQNTSPIPFQITLQSKLKYLERSSAKCDYGRPA